MNRTELRRLAEQATPGEWATERRGDDGFVVETSDTTGWKAAHPEAYIAKLGGWGYSGNGKYIASANPQAVIQLLDALDEAESFIDWARRSGHPALKAKADYSLAEIEKLCPRGDREEKG